MPDRIEVHGAGKRGVDFIEVPTPHESRIEALLEERRGYAQSLDAGDEFRHGMPVKATLESIDAQISNLGGTIPQPFEVPPRPTTEAEFAKLPILDPAALTRSEAPAPTAEACTHPDCVLVHPHDGEAVLSEAGALQLGLVYDRAEGGYRPKRAPGRKPSI